MMMAASTLSSGHPLSRLLQGIVSAPVPPVDITGLATDSRKVQPGDLFIAHAVGGDSGVPYIAFAVHAGAVAVVAEAVQLPEPCVCSVPLFRVTELSRYTGIIADRFYAHPSGDMTIIGVTGTNGKTSVSHLLTQSLQMNDTIRPGLIGTLGYGKIEQLQPGPNTTPEAIALQKLLADFRERNMSHVVMEVSSHGLDQYRVNGVKFDQAIFTNLTRDHLDYHGSMDDYAAAKRRLFTDYGVAQAIINLDDPFGADIIHKLPADTEVIGYTLGPDKDRSVSCPCINAKILPTTSGLLSLQLNTPWGDTRLDTQLSGAFNAYNVMAVLGAQCLSGTGLHDAVERLSRCHPIPGRLENFIFPDDVRVVVDYAHTPDALEKVLITLRKTCTGHLHCVFGCGGDRDQGKRPLMGAIAEQYADHVIVTSDNPRHEDPAQIIKHIIAGIKDQKKVVVEVDRARAIQLAIHNANKGDVILIAGKGHENYQEIAGHRYPFSDQAVVRSLMGAAS